ncbi:unnamed protein product [Brassica oleracea var. botrytis]|uniref:DUF223 domain-containing protein n=2 Tax=Brassica TaxID=3705 RepID=A0A3P6EB96_BRAOL|nr:unnamed protein product [Brassica napus]CDY28453.1 BnaC07g12810D [Brassica napus]VDD36958.1 unnamed protein product [Brassica oleracea]
MEISQLYLSNLKTGRFKDVVVTRLLRFWGSTLIQSTITAPRLYTFKNLLSEGAVYELSIFYIARSNNHFKLCASPVSIRFTEHSSFVEVVDPAEIIRFCNYEQLRALTDTNIDLSGQPLCVNVFDRLHDKLVLLVVETKHHPSDDMAVAVKLSMVPNPVVKSICSDHTNGPDDVPIIKGCPASTDPEPAHTDSVMTSTETPVDDEKAPSSK